jgi:hypothetical protein
MSAFINSRIAERMCMKFYIWILHWTLLSFSKFDQNQTKLWTVYMKISYTCISNVIRYLSEGIIFQTKFVDKNDIHILLPIHFHSSSAVFKIIKQYWFLLYHLMSRELFDWFSHRSSFAPVSYYFYKSIKSYHSRYENQDAIVQRKHQNCYCMRTFHNLLFWEPWETDRPT